MPRIAPVVVDAILNVAKTICTVAVDQPLLPGTGLDTANWLVEWAGEVYPVNAAQALGRRVVLDLGFPGGESPNNAVSYAPPPHDVKSRWGYALGDFALYPLRIGP